MSPRSRRILRLGLAAGLVALPVASWANPRTTAEVLENHLEAFCPGGMTDPADVGRIAQDYHRHAINVTGNNLGPPTTSVGRANIVAGFAGLFQALPNGCDLVETQEPVVLGEYAYVQWSWPGLAELFGFTNAWGTDTFVVKGGQIQLQTVFIFFE
jgi:hypothetical protein